MKRMFVALFFVMVLSVSGIYAKEDVKFHPVIELSVNPKLAAIKSDSDKKVHTVDNDDFYIQESELSTKVGVEISNIKMFTLIPYINYKGEGLTTTNSSFGIGLDGKASIIKNMDVLFGLGYIGEVPNATTTKSGFKMSMGMSYNIPSAFLTIGVNDSFSLLADMTNKYTTGDYKKRVQSNKLSNEFAINVTCDFLRFFTKIDGGLYMDLALNSEWDRSNIKEKDLKAVKKTSTTNFGIGVVATPLNFFTAKTGIVVSNKSLKEKTGSDSYTETKDAGKNKIGFLIGTKVEFSKMSLEFGYTPYFSIRNGETVETDVVMHTFNLGFNFSL